MNNSIKIKSIILSSILGILVSPNIVLAAEVNVDFSQSKGVFQKYNKYAANIRQVKGSADRQHVKDIGINSQWVYFSPKVFSIGPGNNVWDTNMGGFYGSDRLADDVVAMNGGPMVITITQTMPDWLGYPPDNGRWTEYETMIRDVLVHIRSKYPNTVYINLFSEPNGYAGTEPVGSGWGTNGSRYFQYYLHTANAIKSINAQGGQFKLGGPEIMDYPSTAGKTMVPQFLDYVKNYNNSNPTSKLPLDFISYNYYRDNANETKQMVLFMQNELIIRGMGDKGIKQFIMQWGCDSSSTPNAGPLDNWKLAHPAAWVAANWKELMDTKYENQNIDVCPFIFALGDYAQYLRSILAPLPHPWDTSSNVNLLNSLPDGSVFPMYNVYKMLSMQKNGRYTASSTSDIPDVYPLASYDSTGVALMVSRLKGSNSNSAITNITVNINNLPVAFKNGNVDFKRYLVGRTNSNILDPLPAKQDL
jgi:hypothetical protein